VPLEPSGTRGAYRKNSPAQMAARQRVAETRRCPSCGRRNALSAAMRDDWGDRIMVFRQCRYCGAVQQHQVGK
jgi:DNA-directed RNA polymerase subunit M/transcription elongation factor TFIIS